MLPLLSFASFLFFFNLLINSCVCLKTMHKMGRPCAGVIENFIDQMDYSVRYLFVPLLTPLHGGGASHWTLLVFDGEEGTFSHYNSLKNSEGQCRKSALSMRDRIVSAFKQHLTRNKIEASSQENYPMQTPKCSQQKG